MRKKQYSMKWKVIRILLICWLIPFSFLIAVLGIYMVNNHSDLTAERYRNQLEFSDRICVERLNRVVADSRQASYDGDILKSRQQYLEGALDYETAKKQYKQYLYEQYEHSDAISSVILWFEGEGEEGSASVYSESGNGSYQQVRGYWANDHEAVAELVQELDTSVGFLVRDGKLYMIRNMMDSRYQIQAVLVFCLNQDYCFNSISRYPMQDAVAAWEETTGNTVNDASATSDEAFKARIEMDYPDVLFFFNGADANSFIEAGKVVSIDTIRESYPEYASNMNDDLITPSLVDGVKYAVPVNGYWEAMFVNTAVLDAAGVEVPGADYTWDQFKEDCQKIKDAGYAPIAAALGNIPHYWWEFSIFNNGNVTDHLNIPASVDEAGAWVAGMNDIKELYELGYFPENTLSATDDETFAMFTQDKAAFLVDGSWKVGGIAAACQSDPDDPSTLDTEMLDKFTVTYVPGKGERKATDLIGGLSMGYYISTAAWEDEAKRDAAVSFVETMTSDGNQDDYERA